jgi:predicted dehydrogenase
MIPAFSDVKTMMDDSEPDFAIVANPTIHHTEAVSHLIEKNVHVFVEKPFTTHPDLGEKILKELEGKHLVNQVGYVLRFNDIILEIKELLTQKALGDLISFKIEMKGPTIIRKTKGGWRGKSTKGGGCLYDFASHGIDLSNYFFGEPSEITGSVLKTIYSEDAEDAVFSTFLYPEGTVGSLLVNWSDSSNRKPTYKVDIHGIKGRIIADLHAYKVFFDKDPGVDGFVQGWNNRYLTDISKPVRFYLRGYEFTKQLDYFIDNVIAGKVGNLSSFADGVITDRIIDRIRQDSMVRNF